MLSRAEIQEREAYIINASQTPFVNVFGELRYGTPGRLAMYFCTLNGLHTFRYPNGQYQNLWADAGTWDFTVTHIL